MCVCVSVRNGLPNHAYYVDETFTGDLMGLEEDRRLNSILKKHFYGTLRQNSP